MATLSRIKNDIQVNTSLSSLLNVLKVIAVSQFQQLERSLQTYEAFFQLVGEFLALIDLERIDHPFVRPLAGPGGVIAVTSDAGLLGGLNLQVVLAACRELQGETGELIVIGERGLTYARERSLNVTAYPGSQDETRYVQAIQVRDYCLEQLLAGRIRTLKVVYPRAVSFTLQRVETVNLLPVTSASLNLPDRQPPRALLLESRPEDLVEYLVYLWMGHKLFEIFGLSRLAELAARSVHLEGSSQELERRGKALKLQYFRGRHELIDRSLRELFAARSANESG